MESVSKHFAHLFNYGHSNPYTELFALVKVVNLGIEWGRMLRTVVLSGSDSGFLIKWHWLEMELQKRLTRLKDFTPEWVTWGSQQKATLPKLPTEAFCVWQEALVPHHMGCSTGLLHGLMLWHLVARVSHPEDDENLLYMSFHMRIWPRRRPCLQPCQESS